MEIWEKQERETPKAYQAFCVYRDMGTNRSIQKVSEKLGKSRALIERWSSKYNWIQRAEAYDTYLEFIIRKEKEKKYLQYLENFKNNQKRIAQKISKSALKMLKKVDKKLESSSIDEIPISALPNYYRAIATIFEKSANIEAISLSVEEILKLISKTENTV